MKLDIRYAERFEDRHNGPDARQIKEMLQVVGAETLDQLIDETVPAGIRLQKPLDLPPAKNEGHFWMTCGR